MLESSLLGSVAIYFTFNVVSARLTWNANSDTKTTEDFHGQTLDFLQYICLLTLSYSHCLVTGYFQDSLSCESSDSEESSLTVAFQI